MSYIRVFSKRESLPCSLWFPVNHHGLFYSTKYQKCAVLELRMAGDMDEKNRWDCCCDAAFETDDLKSAMQP